jgi:hypothetical protein
MFETAHTPMARRAQEIAHAERGRVLRQAIAWLFSRTRGL